MLRLSWQERLCAPWYGEINVVVGVLLLVIWMPTQMFIGLYCIADDPVSYVIAHSPAYYEWLNLAHFLALPMAVVLLISGRRLSRGTAGGVLLSVIYAGYGLAVSIVHILLTYFCLYRPLASEHPIWPPTLPGGHSPPLEFPLHLIAFRLAWMIYLGLLLRRVVRFRVAQASEGGK